MNWAREVALRIIRERPNEEVYTVASGVSPSGYVHIGNFREIATPYLVAEELKRLGKKVRYILSLMNMIDLEKYQEILIKVMKNILVCHILIYQVLVQKMNLMPHTWKIDS